MHGDDRRMLYTNKERRNAMIKEKVFFSGSGELFPQKAFQGELFKKGDDVFLYSGNKWIKIENTEPNSKKLTPMVCERCGAPLKSNHCEYCNTIYY